jgi:hypothetical protein
MDMFVSLHLVSGEVCVNNFERFRTYTEVFGILNLIVVFPFGKCGFSLIMYLSDCISVFRT